MHGIVTFLLSGMFLHCLPIVLWQGRGEKRVKRNMRLSLQDLCSVTPWTTLSTVIRCLFKIPLSRFWDRLQIYIYSVIIFIWWCAATVKHLVCHFTVSLSDLCPVMWQKVHIHTHRSTEEQWHVQTPKLDPHAAVPRPIPGEWTTHKRSIFTSTEGQGRRRVEGVGEAQ